MYHFADKIKQFQLANIHCKHDLDIFVAIVTSLPSSWFPDASVSQGSVGVGE